MFLSFKLNSFLCLILSAFFSLSLLLSIVPQQAFAQDEVESEDNYDPFSDYSEFTEAATEEADLNFFKNGRLLAIGISTGFSGFIGGYSDFYKPGLAFGMQLTYFFDLQFALQTGFSTSDHDFSFTANDGSPFRAKMRLFDIVLHGKYFFNTQNMTRVWAEWNPYLIGGVSFLQRSHSNNTIVSSSNSESFDFGAGVEYMFNKKRNYAGFMLIYHRTTLAGEGGKLPDPDSSGSGFTKFDQSGDPITFMATIGINF